MSIEDEIQNRFKADAESILEDNLERLDGMFKYHEDGTIQLSSSTKELNRDLQIYLYLIAKRLMYEAGDTEDPHLNNEFFYEKFSVEETTVRDSFTRLRGDSLIKSPSGNHQVVVENLKQGIEQLEAEVN